MSFARARRAVAMIAVLACGPAPALAAQTAVVSGAVTPGTLTVFSPRGPWKVPPLRKAPAGWRQAVVRVPLRVVDARGSGAGWALSMSAAARTRSGHRVAGLRVSVQRFAVACARCTRPRVRAVLPQALAEQTPVRAFAAARSSGMGTVRLTARLLVTAPLRAAPGPYVLRATVSRVSGP